MVSGLRRLGRLIPLGTRRAVQSSERPLPDVDRCAGDLSTVLLPLGIKLVAAGVSRLLGNSSGSGVRVGRLCIDRITKADALNSLPLTVALIRLLPLIPSPFISAQLVLAQRLMRRHTFVVPLLVAGHRLVRRSRR
jgi:hypothetical protein